MLTKLEIGTAIPALCRLVRDTSSTPIWNNSLISTSLNFGIGVDENTDAALSWYGNAAHHGVDEGALRQGILLIEGIDEEKGVKCFQQAAQSKDKKIASEGCRELGDCYFWGKGVSRDEDAATRYYEEAAWLGNASAMYALSRMYYLRKRSWPICAYWLARTLAAGCADEDDIKPECERNFYISLVCALNNELDLEAGPTAEDCYDLGRMDDWDAYPEIKREFLAQADILAGGKYTVVENIVHRGQSY